jgi:hypothetical protein
MAKGIVAAHSGISAALDFAKHNKMLNIKADNSTFRRKLEKFVTPGPNNLGLNTVALHLRLAGFKVKQGLFLHDDGSCAAIIDTILYVSETDKFIKKKLGI